MNLDDLVYLIGLKQIQIEMLTKEINSLKAAKQTGQAAQKKSKKEVDV